jgi:hypothetical protein
MPDGFDIARVLQDFHSNKAANVEPIALDLKADYDYYLTTNKDDDAGFNNAQEINANDN